VVSVTRSYGETVKANVTVGFRLDSARFGLPEGFAEVSDAARAGFLRSLPRSEDALGPFASLAVFSARFVRLRDLQTFALTEDVRLGPTLSLEARWADAAFGLGSTFLALAGSYSDQRWVRDTLLALGVGLSGRIQRGVLPGTTLVNQEVSASVRLISPRFGPLRLHLFGAARIRGNDLDNVFFGLGSDSGLRSLGPRALLGHDRYQVNVELRTIALNLWTLHVGGVLFYDGGDAPLTLERAGWHQGAGVGLRILIPQFNRDVIRIDLGFPFELDRGGGYTPRLSASFGQAF
jgi:hypothetical protein